MMSNNTFNNNNTNSSLAKEEELQKFESSFFPAGGAPQLANIPQAPPAPTNINNVRAKPINLKTRNWGSKLENGYSGLNRSLYDRPSSWDRRPLMQERSHLLNNNDVLSSSFPLPSSSTSTTSTSRSLVNDNFNIPPCPAGLPMFRDVHSNSIRGNRLRLRNWGYPTPNGWSSSNSELYGNGMRLERDVLLNQLRYTYGPRPNFQQEERAINTTIVENVPTATTTLYEAGPAKVLATTVPVPMLNPPINDGRRYAKLYKKNTNAMATEKGVTKLVKRRGTRRDHLVQPNVAHTLAPIATTSFPLMNNGGMTVVQPATLVSETRSVLPTNTTALPITTGTALPITTGTALPITTGTALPITTGTALPITTTGAPMGISKAEKKRERRALKDQQRFVKQEQRAARKASKRNAKNGNLGQPIPIVSAPMLTSGSAPILTTLAPIGSSVAPIGGSSFAPLQTANTNTNTISPIQGGEVLPVLQQPGLTFVGQTRNVLAQEATIAAPMITVAPMTTGATAIATPIGVSAQPLDNAHVLAGQLGNAPIKRPRRARKAKKGTEQPLYSNIISTTPAPLAAATTISSVPVISNTTTTSSFVNEGIVQPATFIGETRNIVVDPMIKQDYNTQSTISPLAIGNPAM